MNDIMERVSEPDSSCLAAATGPRLLVLLPGLSNGTTVATVCAELGEWDVTVFSFVHHRSKNAAVPANARVISGHPANSSNHGANQKLGFRYAVEQNFDLVVTVPAGADAAGIKFAVASALSNPPAAAALGPPVSGSSLHTMLAGCLGVAQRRLLHTEFAPFDAAYRVYSVEAIRSVPFERNSNDERFDTELAIQFLSSNLPVTRLAASAPTPGDQLSLYVAWKIFRATLRASFHRKTLLYDRKFDVEPVEETYDLKLGFPSSHTAAIGAVRTGASILDLGCGRGYVAREFAKKAGRVTAVDRYDPGIRSIRNIDFHRWDLDGGESPVDVSQYEQIFMLDIIEHLSDPEEFMEKLRAAAARTRPEIILTTANIAFFVTRLMLLAGHFNYGRKGILDRTHTRLFTISSLRELLEQTGYTIEEVRGIPAPYARVLGINWMSKTLAWFNGLLIRFNKGLFSYQIFLRARANPTVHNLLVELQEIHAEVGSANADGSL